MFSLRLLWLNCTSGYFFHLILIPAETSLTCFCSSLNNLIYFVCKFVL